MSESCWSPGSVCSELWRQLISLAPLPQQQRRHARERVCTARAARLPCYRAVRGHHSLTFSFVMVSDGQCRSQSHQMPF